MGFVRHSRYLLSTVRHLSVSQVRHRAARMARNYARDLLKTKPPRGTAASVREHPPLYPGLGDPERLSGEVFRSHQPRFGEVAELRFTFLNRTVQFGDRIGWNDPALSQLWRYHLHYFDYALDLAILRAETGDPRGFETFRRLVDSWIEENDTVVGDGWHPFTVSVRCVNWINALSQFERDLAADTGFRTRLVRALNSQLRFLSRELEFDVGGNHLLKNLRALIWGGIAFEGREAERWLATGLSHLERELSRQVLGDGGHFERAPGYHCAVLRDCLESAVWLRRNRGAAPEWLDDMIRGMARFLKAILTPDGSIPLLKDTVMDGWPPPVELLRAVAVHLEDPSLIVEGRTACYPHLLLGREENEKYDALPPTEPSTLSTELHVESGYCVLRDLGRRDYLVVDVGLPCPDSLPAHAHADLLSFELWVGGRKVVTDSGVYEYEAGVWRDYFRSTRAHNTIEVAGQNQSEVWSSFRVARRARPRVLEWRRTDDEMFLRAEHDGYRRLRPPTIHRRAVWCAPGEFWMFVDEVLGDGPVRSKSHLHFHPELSPRAVAPKLWEIATDHESVWLRSSEPGRVVSGVLEPVRQGWYSERFGEICANSVLTMDLAETSPALLWQVFSVGEPAEVELSSERGSIVIEVRVHGRRRRATLLRDGATQ